jgi:hypothetical protein
MHLTHSNVFCRISDAVPCYCNLCCHTCRPSKLPEEDTEDHFSSSLDLSEIHLNFDLEESEMQIFSEDETLVSASVGSGSIMSHASPHMGAAVRVRQQMVSMR